MPLEEIVERHLKMAYSQPAEEADVDRHTSLKHSLLGPSLEKSGQDGVDQKKASVPLC